MKKHATLLALVIFSRFAYGVCDTALSVAITSNSDTICASDSAYICAPAGYASYQWNNGRVGPCIETQYAGNYWVTVTDTGGCTATSNHLGITVFANPPIAISAYGDTLQVYNVMNVQWFLNGYPIQGATAAIYIMEQPGNYTVEVVNSNGCAEFSAPYTYSGGGGNRFSVIVSSNGTVCSGNSIILQSLIFNGVQPYSYLWSSTGSPLNCNTCANPTVIVTQNSVFSLTVTDADNQTASSSASCSVSGQADSLHLSLSNTNISCLQPSDSTVAFITGDGAPFTVSWGDGTISTPGDGFFPHNYMQPGIYVINVSEDFGNCVTTAFDTILNTGVAITVISQVNPICGASNNGKIIVATAGGIAPYSYLWSTGAHSDSIMNLTSGSYALTVTDSANCSFSQSIPLPALDEYFYIYLNENDANCGNNGDVILSTEGGRPPYLYSWGNSVTTQNISNLSVGNYAVTVTDSLGCQAAGATYVNSNCYSYITGLAFIDSNNNCIFDNGESYAGGVYITATSQSGQSYYACTDFNGNYNIAVDSPGVYNLNANIFSYYQSCANVNLCGNNSQTVTIAASGDTSANNNFGIENSTGFDLTIHPGWTSADPGFQKEYWVMPYNQSFTPFNGVATVIFTYDSNLIYQYSLPPLPEVDLDAHTLTWLVDTVPYPIYDWYNVRFQNFFLVPANLSLSYLLQSDFYILPTIGDCDSSNNNLHFSEVVTGSHDPNEKSVSPSGSITENDSILTYTINFQNTGTDSTFFIIVLDTLPQGLNPATVVNLASSNKYSDFSISGKGILQWTFNPLRLPDSAASPSGSKGFITFSVKKLANLPIGTIISNTASVYFDYNPPVRTNGAVDTVSILNGINNISKTAISVTAYPNPFADATNILVSGLNEKYNFQLYDVTGQLVKEITGIGQSLFQLNRGQLTSGIYFYRISIGQNQVAYGKLVAM